MRINIIGRKDEGGFVYEDDVVDGLERIPGLKVVDTRGTYEDKHKGIDVKVTEDLINCDITESLEFKEEQMLLNIGKPKDTEVLLYPRILEAGKDLELVLEAGRAVYQSLKAKVERRYLNGERSKLAED